MILNFKEAIRQVRQRQEEGPRAEARFESCAQRHGWRTLGLAGGYLDQHGHMDFFIYKNGQRLGVDVKAAKRIRRQDPEVQFDWLWVELHGVRETDPGWLHGKADLIAFEMKDYFLIVKRVDLLWLVETRVDCTKVVTAPEVAKYAVYPRPGRHDQLTLLETEAVRTIRWAFWRD